MLKYLLCLLMLTGLTLPAGAETFANQAALEGLETAKAVFDVNQDDPDLLLLRLQLVDKTYQQLKDAGKNPQFVLTFRGGASRFLTRGETYLEAGDEKTKAAVEELLVKFHAAGIPLEQCAIAAGLAKIKTDAFLDEVEVVANGYTSMIAYQNKGYAFIPME